MDYFQTNAQRMRYAEFRRQGLFIGCGVVEAGCTSSNRECAGPLTAPTPSWPWAAANSAAAVGFLPLALAVIGGLLIATVLSLMVTPAVYYYLTRNSIETKPA